MFRGPSFRDLATSVSKKVPSWSGSLLAVLLAAACVGKPPSIAVVPPPAEPVAPKGAYAVATESSLATEAAESILARGGSAVDAAIAAVLVAGVTVPSSSGIGGGGFAMVWDASKKKAIALDFRETAPMGADPAELEKRPAARGAMVGVPGEIAGLFEMHERWGKLPIKDDFARAIELAEKGFTPGPHILRAAKMFPGAFTEAPQLGPWLGVGTNGLPLSSSTSLPSSGTTSNGASGPVGSPGVAVAAAGSTGAPMGVNPQLGSTLRTIAGKGRAGFYEGFVAHWIVDAVRSNGGTMSLDDLRLYKVVEREPLKGSWEGLDAYTMPPPSSGGLMLLEMLGSFDKADLAAQDPSTPAGAHVLAETLRQSLADRMRHVGDPAFGGHALTALLAPARLKARRAAIKPDATHAPSVYVAEDHGTTHLVVADGEGNIVSLTTTVNNPFGSRIMAEGPGILLNDEMDDFTRRYRATEMGIADPPGVMKPGARPPSSMTPTLIVKNGAPLLTLGGSGGMRIGTGVALVTAAVLARGVALPQAIAQTRFHVLPTGEMVVEANAFDASAKKALTTSGERLKEETNISAIQGISWKDGRLEAGADPRKFGLASVHTPR